MSPSEPRGRLASLDVLRGAVMVLMALDHVRVYAGVPAGGPSPAVFFTRWVTHFCAPVFVFLAGTAAFLRGRRVASRGALARYLLLRGLSLILLELTVLRFTWTFNFDYASFTFVGVNWVIGAAMALLAALVWLPPLLVGALGLAVIAGHNAIGPMLQGVTEPPWWLRLSYVGGSFRLGGVGWNVAVLYVLLPWAGVMAAGYGFGSVVRLEARVRRRICLGIGAGAVALFVLLRTTAWYGDPNPWSTSAQGLRPAFAFLNTTKYPPSLLFLLMTLGPAILLLPFLERATGRIATWLRVFGEVPLFYYVLHIPLIHAVALLIAVVRTPEHAGWLFANHPLLPPPVPDGYRYGLVLLYAVTLAVVVALYAPCRWQATRKAAARTKRVTAPP